MWPYIESVKGKNYKEFPLCLSWMLKECGAMSWIGFNMHINIRYFEGCEYSNVVFYVVMPCTVVCGYRRL